MFFQATSNSHLGALQKRMVSRFTCQLMRQELEWAVVKSFLERYTVRLSLVSELEEGEFLSVKRRFESIYPYGNQHSPHYHFTLPTSPLKAKGANCYTLALFRTIKV